MKARFAIALVSAIIGGALLGVGAAFFEGMVPNDTTRWAFYFFFGIPIWIAAEIFGGALYAFIVPTTVRKWGNVARGVYLIVISCVTLISAFIAATKITS